MCVNCIYSFICFSFSLSLPLSPYFSFSQVNGLFARPHCKKKKTKSNWILSAVTPLWLLLLFLSFFSHFAHPMVSIPSFYHIFSYFLQIDHFLLFFPFCFICCGYLSSRFIFLNCSNVFFFRVHRHEENKDLFQRYKSKFHRNCAFSKLPKVQPSTVESLSWKHNEHIRMLIFFDDNHRCTPISLY